MSLIWMRVRGMVVVLWAVAALRLILDGTMKPGVYEWPALLASVFVVSGVLLLVIGFGKTWDDLSYRQMLGAFLMVAFLCWTVPNAVAYTTGQFQGWTHGRFRPENKDLAPRGEDEPPVRSAPVAETPAGKIRTGLMIGGATLLSGFAWLFIAGTLFVYVPKVVRRNRKAPPPDGASTLSRRGAAP